LPQFKAEFGGSALSYSGWPPNPSASLFGLAFEISRHSSEAALLCRELIVKDFGRNILVRPRIPGSRPGEFTASFMLKAVTSTGLRLASAFPTRFGLLRGR